MATQVTANLPASFGKSGSASPTGPSGSGGIATDSIGEFTAGSGVTLSSGLDVTSGAAPTVFHSGGAAPVAVTSNTDKTATNTETYIVEMFIPFNTTITGIAIIGTASSTGNIQISMADSTGAPIAAAQTASTATVAAAAYQQVPFVAPWVAKGPAKYFVLLQNSGSNHFEAHTIGNFGASKKTGETYGTFTAVTPPVTFTTALGPVCDTY